MNLKPIRQPLIKPVERIVPIYKDKKDKPLIVRQYEAQSRIDIRI